MARIALRPYAKLPQNSRTTTIATKANDLGGSEALGAMFRLARIEVTDDLTPEAYARFEAEGADIMDMLQNSTLNWSVVLSLLLTMYVSMAVMHTGSSAYASQVAPPPSGWLSPHMVMTRGVSWSWTWTWRLAGRARWCVTDE